MRILLLTDVPPSTNFSSGIFLLKEVSFIPHHSLTCFVVQNRFIYPKIPETLKTIKINVVPKPLENYGHKRLGNIQSFLFENYHALFTIPRLIQSAVEFALTTKVDVVWAMLQGQTMIRMARPVANKLQVPLFTQIYDPPGWWMRDHKVNKWVAQSVISEFNHAILSSQKVACCSWAMADFYKETLGANTLAVVAGLEKSLAKKPATKKHNRSDFIISMAGQLYSKSEWICLLNLLCQNNWQIAGKNIKVKYLGPQLDLYAEGRPMNIEYLGWRSQEETIKIFEDSDLLYCPYWFDPNYEMESRLSFPSKLTSYLASGRPVLFHGPEYSSPGKFLEQNKAAALCYSLDPDLLQATLEKIITDEHYYQEICINGRKAFDSFLSTEFMQKNFHEFLGII